MTREQLRPYIPAFLLRLHWKYFKSKVREFKTKNTEEIFTYIYKENHWRNNESASGDGSTLNETQYIRKELPLLLQQYQIKSILDIPCGDFNWMQHINLTGINYTGADIVKDLIVANSQKHSKPGIQFTNLDLTTDNLPAVDLIICRDCLVHLSQEKVIAALRNIKRSGSKYLLTTSHISAKKNRDIVTGDWRPVNLVQPPYSLPQPITQFKDTPVTGENEFSDKVMALWEIKNLPL